MRKKLISAAALTAVLLTGMGAVLAASGTAGDPFVSLSYINGTYYTEMEEAMLQRVQAAAAQTAQAALDKLEQLNGQAAGNLPPEGYLYYAGSFTRLTFGGGGLLELPTGSSLLVEDGQGALGAVSGVLVDVTAGSQVAGGGALQDGHRYVAAEGSACTLAVSGEATLSVQGWYNLTVQLPYTDVDAGEWFYSSVCYVYQTGLFKGVSATEFSPHGTMSRGMLALVLCRLAGAEGSAPDAGFTDVPAGEWYAGGVNWAASAGVVNGVGDGSFNPNGNVTREQIASMLYRYAGDYLGLDVSASGDLSGFTDLASVSQWAEEAVSWAVGVGIMKGGDDSRLNPGGTATRAEAAALLERFSALLP